MSLIRLLSAGPSLMPLNGQAKRYRSAGQGMLPTFGSVRPACPPTELATRATAAQPSSALAQARALSLVPQPAMIATGRNPAPAEMTLENVRVVRNDLRDADMEWQLSGDGGFARKAGNLWRRMMRRLSGAPA